MKPAVTVLIDTYNHERFIDQAIVSVLEQDFPAGDMEILVVDDGSTDRTRDIVRKFEPRVRLLQKKNGGQASAFNAGISEAKGGIVAFLDGDDWWARQKVTRVADTLTGGPELGLVGHGISIVNRDGRERLEILREGFKFKANTLEGARLFRVRGSFLGTSRMTIRADVLRRIGPVPEAIVIQADEFLSTMATAISGTQILPEPLTYYRLHDFNSFQFSSYDPQRMRVKQGALVALSNSLSARLESLGIDPQVIDAILEFPKASADQLRLMIDGGWPWETLRTEWKIYGVLHPDAAPSHRVFKLLTLLGALGTTPRGFYSVQRRVAKSSLYQRVRKRWLPPPEMTHIQRDWRTG